MIRSTPAHRLLTAALIASFAGAACATGSNEPGTSGTGGDTASVGRGGAAAATGGRSGSGGTGTGGASGDGTGGAGTGGASGDGGSGGGAGGAGGTTTPPIDDAAAPNDGAPAGGTGGAGDAAPGPATSDGGTVPTGPGDYGKVGEMPLIPLQYAAAPVPPIIASECPDDPTTGFTEYQDSFVVQRPYDLAAGDRFKYENGIYTFWVNSSDKAHAPGNGTAPRTEARYSDISTGEHIWSADVMFESPSRTCIMQIHNVVGAIAIYLRDVGNRLFNLSSGKTILTDQTGKWFNLKVAFNTQTRQVRTFVNNCLKETSTAPSGTPFWYFKNGVYTCDSGTCRSNYKNVHLFQKGSTDKPNTRSTYK